MIIKNIELFPSWKRMNVSLHTQEIIFTGMERTHGRGPKALQAGLWWGGRAPPLPQTSRPTLQLQWNPGAHKLEWPCQCYWADARKERYKATWVNPFKKVHLWNVLSIYQMLLTSISWKVGEKNIPKATRKKSTKPSPPTKNPIVLREKHCFYSDPVSCFVGTFIKILWNLQPAV